MGDTEERAGPMVRSPFAVAVCGCVVSAALLSACGGSSSAPSVPPPTQVPTKLVFVTPPGGVVAGARFTPVVATVDASGHLVATGTYAVTLTLGQFPAGGSLYGTTTVNSVGGTATFPNVWFEKAGSGYTMNAFSPPLASATTSAFNVAPGAIAALWVNPGAAVLTFPTGSISVQLHATAVDAFQNPLTGTLWTTSDVTSTTVSASGLVTGGSGTALVIASLDGLSDTVYIVTVCVLPRCSGVPNATVSAPSTARAGENFTALMTVSCGAFGCGGFGSTSGIASIAIGDNPVGGVLSGNPNAQTGVLSDFTPWNISWANLKIDRPGTYTLVAGVNASGNGIGARSASITITP